MASGDIVPQHTRDCSETAETPTTLLDLLSNALVFEQTVPYLSPTNLLSLASTSRSFRDLVYRAPATFRYLNLGQVKSAQLHEDSADHGGEIWRNVQDDDNVTEDEFYSRPLRDTICRIRKRDLLQNVHTLVLDGLSVTAEFCNEILVDPSYRVRILSIREVKNLNEGLLMQSLRYACRPTRSEDTPRLQALYVFGKRDAALPVASSPPKESGPGRSADISIGWNHKSQNALQASILAGGDPWYSRQGRLIRRPITDGWAETLLRCREVISFDATLCTGPRHQNSVAFGKMRMPSGPAQPASPCAVATFAVGGCASCGSAPEGFTVFGESPAEDWPLLSPIPLHSSSAKAAKSPVSASGEGARKPSFVPRCLDCIRERYCFSCNQWWCESCYQVPTRDETTAQTVQVVDEASGLIDHELAALEPPKIKTPKISRSCWECEHNCLDCIANTQKLCKACGGGYCIIHYEGSTMTLVRIP
ncbi:hypothetical protein F4780DRAFT_262488 [Xylariomycetidae sp. FL0641]|nr:hypothetical protein F4780DRAFT_262488 [Xylariomycetidae sp. FL0641]